MRWGVQKLTDVDDRIRERRLPLLAPENRDEQQNPHNFHVVREMFLFLPISNKTHRHTHTQARKRTQLCESE